LNALQVLLPSVGNPFDGVIMGRIVSHDLGYRFAVWQLGAVLISQQLGVGR
jgi:hypothetical protein